MNDAALIIWFSAAGRLLFRAARLIEHTSGFQLSGLEPRGFFGNVSSGCAARSG
jgi:hypothetical protein